MKLSKIVALAELKAIDLMMEASKRQEKENSPANHKEVAEREKDVHELEQILKIVKELEEMLK